MLTVHQLSKSYGVDKILDDVTFNVSAGERVGLIGPNGGGKTTLLRILAGIEQADSGSVQVAPSDLRVGYLPQGLQFAPDETMQAFLSRAYGDVQALTTELERLADLLTRTPARPELQLQYDATLGRLSAAAEQEESIRHTLRALGLDALPLETPVQFLSGGQKTRLALAVVLLSEPELLLLDEPTNHLDIAMLEWLEDWLNDFRGGALVVSHDRTFLDQTVTRILELDPSTHRVRMVEGNYENYVALKEAERGRQWQAYSDQQEEILRLENTARQMRGLAKMKKGGKADSGDKFAKGYFANRSARWVGRAKQMERRIEHLQTDERVEKPRDTWQLKLDFGATPVSGQDVLLLQDLSIGYDSPLLREINLHVRHGERVALIGANGAGKTTLLRTIAGQVLPIAGHVRLGTNVRLGYMTQEQEGLDPDRNALASIREVAPLSETDARHFLHFFLFTGDEVFTPVRSLSFGERARLMLATLVARGCNFLLLDEPINHLDIPSRTRFEQALAQFDGTVLAVVHDRYFIERFATRIWQCEEGTVKE